MPITDALKTAKEFERVGLPPAVAELLATKFEETAQATHDSLKDFIRQEFATLRGDLNVKFAQIDSRFADQEAKFERSLRTLLGILIGVVSLAVAIIKLFPNWH